MHFSVRFPYLIIFSKFFSEFRRFSLKKTLKFEEFKSELEQLHGLTDIPFFVYYTDPTHGDLLPINNDDNFALGIKFLNIIKLKKRLKFQLNLFLAISLAVPCLKLHLQTSSKGFFFF